MGVEGQKEWPGYLAEVPKAQCETVVDNIAVSRKPSESSKTRCNSTQIRGVLEEFQLDEESNIMKLPERQGVEGSSNEEEILQKLQHMEERDLRQFLDLAKAQKDVQA
ncbi:hypothetical protein Ancab_019498 [Ancistrocladus abbreviatus]